MSTDRARVLLFDIETAPQGWRQVAAAGPPWVAPLPFIEAAERAAMTAEPPKNYRKQETIERWRDEQIEGSHAQAFKTWSDGSLDPKYGEVVCVTAGTPEGQRWEFGISDDAVQPERLTLDGMLGLLDNYQPDVVVAHNIEDFDGPYLWVRGALGGVPRLSRWFSGAVYYRDRVNARVPTTITVKEPAPPEFPAPHTLVRVDRPRLVDSMRLWPEDPLAGGGGDVLAALLERRAGDVLAHGRADIERLAALWDVLTEALGI